MPTCQCLNAKKTPCAHRVKEGQKYCFQHQDCREPSVPVHVPVAVSELEPCLQGKYADKPRENVVADAKFFYKVVPNDNVEVESYQKLKNTQLIPAIVQIKKCQYQQEPRLLIQMERYQGDFGDFIDKWGQSREEISNALNQVVTKSLELNTKYLIRHDDFHI